MSQACGDGADLGARAGRGHRAQAATSDDEGAGEGLTGPIAQGSARGAPSTYLLLHGDGLTGEHGLIHRQRRRFD